MTSMVLQRLLLTAINENTAIMAYYAKKEGLEHYRLARASNECKCFVCGETIPKGCLRYAEGWLSLCTKCGACWEAEGGRLGEISRARKDNKKTYN